jgi:hypothetical protein
MKVRKGFVSNSSSSSFVCDLSGEVFEGYDSGISEFGCVQCVEGHTFVYEGYPAVEAWVDSDANDECNYDLPKEICPICNGDAKPELVKRFTKEFKRLNITVEDFK